MNFDEEIWRSFMDDIHNMNYPRQSGKSSAFRSEWQADLEPRRGYIDACRDDNCVAVITTVGMS